MATKPIFAKHSHDNQPQTYEELLEQDSRPVPDYLRSFGDYDVGPTEVPKRWYLDPKVYQAEIEHIWKKKWQMACRVDHVKEVGDTYVYEVGPLSFIIVRASKDVIKGYWNSCLHRGNLLQMCSGRVDRLQCPFHGFTWSLDGKSVMITHEEEFPEIDREKFSLPEVQVGVWQGFVFINPDLDAEPLESYLAPLDNEPWRVPYTKRQLAINVSKTFGCNWKLLQEAFMESFHVLTTHPQFAISMGERCTHYGAIGNVSRGVLTNGLTNDYVARTPSEDDIFRSQQEFWDDEESAPLSEGMTARGALIEGRRNLMRPVIGAYADEASDVEVVDLLYYTLFPNFFPFGAFGQPMLYRFRPLGDDPLKSVMDVWFLIPLPEGVEPGEPAPPVLLSEDQEFTDCEALGSYGAFISQDSDNLAGGMKGLRNSQTGFLIFSKKYESKIRHFYSLYEKALGLSAADEVRALKNRR